MLYEELPIGAVVEYNKTEAHILAGVGSDVKSFMPYVLLGWLRPCSLNSYTWSWANGLLANIIPSNLLNVTIYERCCWVDGHYIVDKIISLPNSSIQKQEKSEGMF